MSVNFRSAAHIGAESHHYYRQLSAPTGLDPLQVGDLWSDTTANLLKRCTSVSPITFVSTEGGSAGHDLFSTTHGDVDELDVPSDGQILKYNLAAAKWRAEDDAAGHGDNAHDGTILSDVVASRPAAATVDRFFWATDEHILYRDTGAAWVKASVADHPDIDGAGPNDHHSQSHSDGDHTAGFAAPTGAVDIGDAAAEGAGATHSRSDHQHQFSAPSAGYPLDVAAAEADGTATTPARSDHGHAHGSGYSPDAHHARSHDHSAAADGDTLTPATLNIPFAVTPAQTAEGQAVWDSDGDRLTVGTGAGRKTLINGEDAPGGELSGTYDAPTVDATHSGSAITTGKKGHVEIPFAIEIEGWTILGDQAGSIVVDVNRSTFAGFPTLTSIAGTELPTLASAQKNQDLTLTTWTTTIAAGDVLEFEVDSAATVQRVTVAIRGRKTWCPAITWLNPKNRWWLLGYSSHLGTWTLRALPSDILRERLWLQILI